MNFFELRRPKSAEKVATPMNYRVVYDVLNDSPAAGREHGLIFFAAALGWTALWAVFWRTLRRRDPPPKTNWRMGFLVGSVLTAVGLIVAATETYPTFIAQRQCRDWLRRGDHLTAEGRISDYYRGPGSKAQVRFRVGEVGFEFRMNWAKAGGFRGFFTEPDTEAVSLRNDLPVRIAHRDGRILRIEIAH